MSLARSQRKKVEKYKRYEMMKTLLPPFISSSISYLDASSHSITALIVSKCFSKCALPDCFIPSPSTYQPSKYLTKDREIQVTPISTSLLAAHAPQRPVYHKKRAKTAATPSQSSIPAISRQKPFQKPPLPPRDPYERLSSMYSAPGSLNFSFNFYPL